MLQKCPLCGAETSPDEQCRDRFDIYLALEYENPTTFGAVHLLTVACYMLQHNAYSRDGWLEARKMVTQFIEQGITPVDIIKQNRQRLDSGHRKWGVTKGTKLAEFEPIIWSRTIADVRLDNPEIYCADIKCWAISILEDTDSIVQNLNSGLERGMVQPDLGE